MKHRALTARQWGASALIHLSVLGLLAVLVKASPPEDAYVPLDLSISWAALPVAHPEPAQAAVEPEERRVPLETPDPPIERQLVMEEQEPVLGTPTPMVEKPALVADEPAPVIPEEVPLVAANTSQPLVPPVVAQPEPVVSARFDAAYLNNPAPVYPLLSRRLREEGKVLLQVRVSVQGRAEHLHVKKSSGYRRLDEAAQQAVAQWRFIPARQGEKPVASDVTVPVVFRLQGARADCGGWMHDNNKSVFV